MHVDMVLGRLHREWDLAAAFTHRDWTASVIPGLLFALAALLRHHSPPATAALHLLQLAGYLALYIYTFCLGNQLAGMKEDALNKPDRPLVAGLVTVRAAWVRWGLLNAAFPLYAYAVSGLEMAAWAVGWQVLSLLYNQGRLDQHWFTKNVIFITLGSVLLLGASWRMVAPLDAWAWRWVWLVSAGFGVSLNVQDLRDVEGDRAQGRRTLPVVVGPLRARRISAVVVAALPALVWGVGFGGVTSAPVVAFQVLLATLNLAVVVRLLRPATPTQDDCTYRLHTGWFCVVLLGAALGA